MDRQSASLQHLTRKQLDVLDVFLRRPLDYLANPAKVRRDSMNQVTKAWSREACDRLVSLGILSMEEVRPRKKRGLTPHYRLVRSPVGFRSLVWAYTGSLMRIYGPDWPLRTGTLFESDYIRANLTPEFVRRVLSERGVEIRYNVDRRTLGPAATPTDWDVAPGEYSDHERSIALCFPVLDSKASVDELKRAIHPFAGDNALEPQDLQRIADTHYRSREDRMLVLPILGLLQVSGTALITFMGPWEPYSTDYMSSSDQGTSMVEHLLFRLVFAAIGDLSMSRFVPDGLDVTFAEVRPDHSRAQRHDPALLQLCWRGREIIGYEAGFDTEHLFVGGEDSGTDISEVTRNPENCWMRVWWDSYRPMWGEVGLEANIGYKFADRKLLEWALTHSSAADSTDETKQFVDKVSWLGDAILQSVATESTFRNLSAADVKTLHDARAEFTTNAFLGRVARQIGLASILRTGKPLEMNPTAIDRHNMHATHLEALIGATYLDGGFRAAARVARRLLEYPYESDDEPAQDA